MGGTYPLMYAHFTEIFKERGEEYEAGFSRPVTFRVNPLKGTREEAEAALRAEGISFSRVPWYGDAYLSEDGGLAHTDLFSEGKIYLQSLSSMLPPLYLGAQAGDSVLDMTAAPGGKTTQICALTGGRALVTACERDRFRFERLQFNLRRQGATRVTALHTDALRLDDAFSFDKILLDAPCTGSGAITPTDRPRLSDDYLRRCVRAQDALLRKAYALLKRGGRLVYSTCSVFPKENWEHFRSLPPDLVPVPVSPFEGIPVLPSPLGILVEPGELYEGFYIAVFEKK